MATATTKAQRIAELSKRDPDRTCINLMPMFSVENLKECFNMLDGKKAVGIDRVKKSEDGCNLDENLEDLVKRMKRMEYSDN